MLDICHLSAPSTSYGWYNNHMKRTTLKRSTSTRGDLIDRFINVQNAVNKLPEFSAVERAKFEHSVAIDHLYNSSKIEGSHLNESGRIEKAIHA